MNALCANDGAPWDERGCARLRYIALRLAMGSKLDAGRCAWSLTITRCDRTKHLLSRGGDVRSIGELLRSGRDVRVVR